MGSGRPTTHSDINLHRRNLEYYFFFSLFQCVCLYIFSPFSLSFMSDIHEYYYIIVIYFTKCDYTAWLMKYFGKRSVYHYNNTYIIDNIFWAHCPSWLHADNKYSWLFIFAIFLIRPIEMYRRIKRHSRTSYFSCISRALTVLEVLLLPSIIHSAICPRVIFYCYTLSAFI